MSAFHAICGRCGAGAKVPAEELAQWHRDHLALHLAIDANDAPDCPPDCLCMVPLVEQVAARVGDALGYDVGGAGTPDAIVLDNLDRLGRHHRNSLRHLYAILEPLAAGNVDTAYARAELAVAWLDDNGIIPPLGEEGDS